jgi:ectoine hydroxylase-related dioxygenase (phytanoyl-CoA dioxygenase family)
LEPPKAVTAWIAISETTPENGCVRAIAGTHLLGQLPHENTYDKDVMLLKGQRVSSPLDEDRAVDFIMRPGEMSLHDAWVVHGSGPNKSSGYRIGCSAVFIPTWVRQLGARESATLVRGRDEYRHFDFEARPNADLDSSAVEAHRKAVGRMQTYKPPKVG